MSTDTHMNTLQPPVYLLYLLVGTWYVTAQHGTVPSNNIIYKIYTSYVICIIWTESHLSHGCSQAAPLSFYFFCIRIIHKHTYTHKTYTSTRKLYVFLTTYLPINHLTSLTPPSAPFLSSLYRKHLHTVLDWMRK